MKAHVHMLSGTVLLTGGSGFLGKAILRRAKRENWPAKWICYSRDETKQWELKHRYPEVTCVLGDVARDIDRLISIMHGVDTVIHMGAVKYIPEAEWNVLETVDVNITGSRNVAMAAIAAGVSAVIGISTDKAAGPANLYGMTKAVMERMFGEFNRRSPHTKFVTCRYGNVVGSTGSVIPVFEKQIKESGQIKVTDSRMTRFWLGVDEAIDLILWSLKESEEFPGHTFISACPAMPIQDLAKAVWRMNSKEEPNIIYTGIRPGEKLHESLFTELEASRVGIANQGFLLAPATETGSRHPEIMGYSSDHPKHWLTIDEMISLITDAHDV